jgi:ABC-type nitrate/sulfonate/bicarbonate transport system substrate-binding protein
MIARTFATSLRFILVLALCEFAPAAPARIAYSSISAAMLPLFVAKDKKLFDKYGVDVELTYIRGVAIEGSIAGANAANFVDASLAQELEREGVLQKKNR